MVGAAAPAGSPRGSPRAGSDNDADAAPSQYMYCNNRGNALTWTAFWADLSFSFFLKRKEKRKKVSFWVEAGEKKKRERSWGT